MKLKFSGNNLNVQLTNTAGEPIYTYQADSLNVELNVAKLVDSIGEIQQTFIDGLEKAFAEPTPDMETIGFQFIKADGYPLGNAQPTLEEAEHVARFNEPGRFYRIQRDANGTVSMRYEYSQHMCNTK